MIYNLQILYTLIAFTLVFISLVVGRLWVHHHVSRLTIYRRSLANNWIFLQCFPFELSLFSSLIGKHFAIVNAANIRLPSLSLVQCSMLKLQIVHKSNIVIVFGDNVDDLCRRRPNFFLSFTIRKVQHWLHLIALCSRRLELCWHEAERQRESCCRTSHRKKFRCSILFANYCVICEWVNNCQSH